MKKIEEVAFGRYLSDQSLPKRKRMDITCYIDWAQLGAREAQRWIPIEEELPPEDGQEILLKNEKWIDEDYNIKGVRAGSYCDEIWTSAYWCGHHDEYHTRTSDEDDDQFTDSLAVNQIPTHWRPIERS